MSGYLRCCGSLALALVLLVAPHSRGGPEQAVCRLASHGGSATVIWTEPGRSYLLSCAHCFEGADRLKPVRVDIPWTYPGPAIPAQIRLVAIDYQADLALLEIDQGPLPVVCVVAAEPHTLRDCLSIGYAEMQLPARQIAVYVLRDDGQIVWTQGKPIEGQSGGALVERATGQLVGVVHGYSTAPVLRGMFVAPGQIRAFLRRVQSGAPLASPSIPAPRRWLPAPPAPYRSPIPGGSGTCPPTG